MNAAARVLLVAAAAWLAWFGAARAPAENAPDASRSLAGRLLGPFAEGIALVEWGRFEAAWRRGDERAAYVHADRALALDPGAAGGWIHLAHHAVYERAAPRREPDARERERWVRTGLDLLERGERAAREPGRVAFKRGVVFLSLAAQADGNRWLPITRREAWTAAAEAFERADAAGEPIAAEAAHLAREAAAASAGG